MRHYGDIHYNNSGTTGTLMKTIPLFLKRTVAVTTALAGIVSLSATYSPTPDITGSLDKLRGYGRLTFAAGGMDIDTYSSNLTTAQSAIAWFKKTRVPDLVFNSTAGRFDTREGASLWYRFYDLVGDKGFFCDRDGIKTYDLMTVSEKRRTGYSWGGD